ncbi:MAG: 1,4-dihydroxy-2-naphthoate polyprenyltransferase [Cytophagales bacterium]|nr:1,4-dihydroxy-2-naphthoate polyprenyltransferase [Cytophagales bacterium]
MTRSTWLVAFRLRTLPLSLASIGMGGFLAASRGRFDVLVFTLCCLTTVFLQILSNLANDYGDTVHGADHEGRTGPRRTVQSGAIPLGTMRRAMLLFVVLSFASGVSLLLAAFGLDFRLLSIFLGLGLLAIAAAVTYTAGSKPYGYAGLGDVSVLVFFGFIGVTGSLFLFIKEIAWWSLLPAIACGFFSMGVLNINNIRDMESDRLAGKYSIPVRVGRKWAGYYHWLLSLGGMLAAVLYTGIHFQSVYQFLFLLSMPLFLAIGVAVNQKPASQLDPYLKRMAMATLLFVLLFGVGQLIS